jgi:hypothetical protein
MDNSPSPPIKKFISTPVVLTGTRTGVIVLPIENDQSLNRPVLREEIITMSSKDKEYTFFDRKLILNNNGKSYSGIILPRPTLTDR